MVMDDCPASSRMNAQPTTEADISNDNNDTNTPMNSTRAVDNHRFDRLLSKSNVWDYAIKLPDQQTKCLKCNR